MFIIKFVITETTGGLFYSIGPFYLIKNHFFQKFFFKNGKSRLLFNYFLVTFTNSIRLRYRDKPCSDSLEYTVATYYYELTDVGLRVGEIWIFLSEVKVYINERCLK